MTDHDPQHTGDKVPRPLSSEQAQQGQRVEGKPLERPDPDTETIDKVITPTSVKELEEQTAEIERRLREAREKGL